MATAGSCKPCAIALPSGARMRIRRHRVRTADAEQHVGPLAISAVQGAQLRRMGGSMGPARQMLPIRPMHTSWLLGLVGGFTIGAASALLLVTHGRIAGISGIFGSMFQPDTADRAWRIAFVLGLAVAGITAELVAPSAVGSSPRALPVVAIAGLLVGFGTRMGSGCTSGHGVCGLSRLSRRSFIAVMTFMATGALTAWFAGVS